MKNKRPKRAMGKLMQSKEESKRKGFWGSYRHSKAWLERSQAVKNKLAKKANRVRVRKAERAKAIKEGKPVVYSIK